MTPYDHESLWAKSQSTFNRSFAARERGDFAEAALWASIALELLGKAALSRINPLLVADPMDDGRSLLIAAGVNKDSSRKSIQAKAVFSRCARCFPAFSEQEAGLIAGQRNADLHSGMPAFAGIDESNWWERFWAQVVILIHAQDRTLRELVGDEREPLIEGHLQANAQNVARRAQAMIERARQRYALAETSAEAREQIKDLLARGDHVAAYSAWEECPACHQDGEIFGDYVEESDVEYDYDEGTAIEWLRVVTDAYICSSCGLRLIGSEYLARAELPHEIEIEQDYEPDWYDYGND